MSFEKDLKLCEETIVDRFLAGSSEEDLNKQDNLWCIAKNNNKIKCCGEQSAFETHFLHNRKEFLREKVTQLKEDLIKVSDLYLSDGDTLEPTERALLKVVKTVANYHFDDSFFRKFCPSFSSYKAVTPEECQKISKPGKLRSNESEISFKSCRLSEENPSIDPDQPRHRLPLARSGIPLARSSPSPVYKISRTFQAQPSQSTCSFQSAKSSTFDWNHEVNLANTKESADTLIGEGQGLRVHGTTTNGGGDFQKEPKLGPSSIGSAVQSTTFREAVSHEYSFEKSQSRMAAEGMSRRSATITQPSPLPTKTHEDLLYTSTIDKFIFIQSPTLIEKENFCTNAEDRYGSLKAVGLMETGGCQKTNETLARTDSSKPPDNDKKDIDFDMIDTLLKRVGYFEQLLTTTREEAKLKIQQMSDQRNYFLKNLEHIKETVQNVISDNEFITKNFKALETDLENRENEIKHLQHTIKRLMSQQKYNIEPTTKERVDLVQIHNWETARLRDENMNLRVELEKQTLLNRLNLNMVYEETSDVQPSSSQNKNSPNNKTDVTYTNEFHPFALSSKEEKEVNDPSIKDQLELQGLNTIRTSEDSSVV
ncbi:hypothetical protein WDU94_014598 [Cyamophila willieti]